MLLILIKLFLKTVSINYENDLKLSKLKLCDL